MSKNLRTLFAVVLVASMTLVAAVGPAAAAGDVTVTVEDADGSGIEGANVTVYNASNDTAVTNDTTGTDGNVTFSNVTDGDYYAEADADGYMTGETGTFTVAGSAVAETVTLTEASEVLNATVPMNNETVSLWAEALLSNSSEVTVSYYGIDGNGTETELFSETVSAPADGWEMSEYEVSQQEIDDYDDARIVIEGPAEDVAETNYGRTVTVAGGGGGGLPTGATGAVGAIVVLGGAYVILRED